MGKIYNNKMQTFGDSLVLLFVIVLLYILVYCAVNWLIGNKVVYQTNYFGGILGGREHSSGKNKIFGGAESGGDERVDESADESGDESVIESADETAGKKADSTADSKADEPTNENVAENYLILHYKKIAQRNPDAKNKIIVQLHSTDWCKFCQKMKPIWEKATLRITNDPKFSDKFLFLEQNQDECNSPGIKTVPAIFKFIDGENDSLCSQNDQHPQPVLKKYENVYDVDELYNWILSA